MTNGSPVKPQTFFSNNPSADASKAKSESDYIQEESPKKTKQEVILKDRASFESKVPAQ